MKKFAISFFLIFSEVVLFAQKRIVHPGVDTTSEQYKIGQRIGGWLPVVVIISVLLMYIRHSYKHGKLGKRRD